MPAPSSSHAISSHAISTAGYVFTWLALLALSALTGGLALAPLGGAATATAVVIASIKGLLILLYFMHIREQRIANAYVLMAALILISFFIALTAADIPTRDRTDLPASEPAAAAPVRAPVPDGVRGDGPRSETVGLASRGTRRPRVQTAERSVVPGLRAWGRRRASQGPATEVPGLQAFIAAPPTPGHREEGVVQEPLGRTRWAIAEGYIPASSHGPAPEMESHEACCILNTGDRDAHVEITLFFTDDEPVGPYRFSVPARRTRHLRFNEFQDPAPVPDGTPYASVIESDVPIVVQHTRLDSRQAENALLSTIAFPGDSSRI